MTRHEELRQKANAFHAEHPEVWLLFSRFALEAIESGRRLGAKAIWERLRWETAVNPRYRESGEWKLDNSLVSFYARRFARAFPEHAEFFAFRVQKSAEREAA